MKKFQFFKTCILCMFVSLVIAVNAQPVINANVVTFTILGATNTYVTCINDSNDIGGYYENSSGIHGFIYIASENDTFFIDYPGAQDTWVYGLNNEKVIVGSYNNTGSYIDNEGFKYTKATNTYEDITSSWLGSMDITIARDINDSYWIVGDCRWSAGTTHIGFSMFDGVNNTFQYNFGTGNKPTYINRLNNSGTCVGFWIDGVNNYGLKRSSAGAWTQLNYPGAQKTRLTGISDSNTIIGTFNLTRSFIYQHGMFMEIKKSGTTNFQVQDINNSGYIAGYYQNADGTFSGFYMSLWDIGFRPYINGWAFSNSEANMWPESWWNQFNYAHDPYLGGNTYFPKVMLNTGIGTIPSKVFPDWP